MLVRGCWFVGAGSWVLVRGCWVQRSQADIMDDHTVADNMAFDASGATPSAPDDGSAPDNYAPSQDMSLRPASQVGAGLGSAAVKPQLLAGQPC